MEGLFNSKIQIPQQGLGPTDFMGKGINATLDPSKPVAMVKNPDGSTSTVRTIGVNKGGVEYVIPTVHPDGYIMDDKTAYSRFLETGGHFGGYNSVEASNIAANSLHEQQALLIR